MFFEEKRSPFVGQYHATTFECIFVLCEQVIGRGLRRVGYDVDDNGLFVPEYVNVFGVPLSVFVDTGDDGVPPPPPKPSTQIESLASRNELEVRWPNLLRNLHSAMPLPPKFTVIWMGHPLNSQQWSIAGW